MSPVICFYNENKFIWSTNYTLYSCPDDLSLTSFLSEFQKNFYNDHKIVKINFDALSEMSSDSRPRYAKTAKANVFVLHSYELIAESELNTKLAGLKNNMQGTAERAQFSPLINEAAFISAVESVKADICRGRFYQMNLTAALHAQVSEKFSALDYFSLLSQKVACPYRAYLPLEKAEIICLSPELFLRKQNSTVITQPIKGTLVTGDELKQLQQSPKENAELSMIVDLLRNDLNTLSCEKYNGSAKVNFHRHILPLGYTTHTYSEIEIETSKNFIEIVSQSFPGGSISGCPKIESLKKIAETETYQRDFYTGSIGWWHADNFSLNIAIRSLYHSQRDLYYFTGCGIVFDSDPAKEWQEFLTKCSFLNLENTYEPVLDTFRFENEKITYLFEHIERSFQALQFQGINVEFATLENMYWKIQTELKDKLNLQGTYKVRLVIEKDLKYSVSAESLALQGTLDDCKGVLQKYAPVKLQPMQYSTRLPRFKTVERKHWDRLLTQKKTEIDDVLVINSNGHVCETSIYNVFYCDGEEFFTPPLNDGCLQGVFRAHHIKKGFITVNDKTFKLSEKSLPASELAHVDLYVANSVRGLKKASLLF